MDHQIPPRGQQNAKHKNKLDHGLFQANTTNPQQLQPPPNTRTGERNPEKTPRLSMAQNRSQRKTIRKSVPLEISSHSNEDVPTRHETIQGNNKHRKPKQTIPKPRNNIQIHQKTSKFKMAIAFIQKQTAQARKSIHHGQTRRREI